MSGVSVIGGSMPLLVFCSIRYMARANCSWFSLPVCLVSASPLQRREVLSFKANKSKSHNTQVWKTVAMLLSFCHKTKLCKLIVNKNLWYKDQNFQNGIY